MLTATLGNTADDLEMAKKSLREEREAIEAYTRRLHAAEDQRLKESLRHARKEEREHAAMFDADVQRLGMRGLGDAKSFESSIVGFGVLVALAGFAWAIWGRSPKRKRESLTGTRDTRTFRTHVKIPGESLRYTITDRITPTNGGVLVEQTKEGTDGGKRFKHNFQKFYRGVTPKAAASYRLRRGFHELV